MNEEIKIVNYEAITSTQWNENSTTNFINYKIVNSEKYFELKIFPIEFSSPFQSVEEISFPHENVDNLWRWIYYFRGIVAWREFQPVLFRMHESVVSAWHIQDWRRVARNVGSCRLDCTRAREESRKGDAWAASVLVTCSATIPWRKVSNRFLNR